MRFTEAHFWLWTCLAFLLGVLWIIAVDFGRDSKLEERVKAIELELDRLKVLELSQSLKNGGSAASTRTLKWKKVKKQ